MLYHLPVLLRTIVIMKQCEYRIFIYSWGFKNSSKIECCRPTLTGPVLNEKPTLQYKLPYLLLLSSIVASDFISFSWSALVPPLLCYWFWWIWLLQHRNLWVSIYSLYCRKQTEKQSSNQSHHQFTFTLAGKHSFLCRKSISLTE